MDTCTFDMLHDTRNQDVIAITYGIDLDFFTHQIFIYKDRVFLRNLIDDSDVFFYIFITDCNTHALSAKNVGRTYKYRIAKLIGCFFCFFGSKDSMSLRSRNLALFQNLIEQFTVFGCIYVFCRCSEDFYTHFHKCFGKFDCGLSTKLYDCSVWFLNIYNVFYIFRCQWFEIQFICNIKIGADSFRVVVYDNCFVALFFECPCTMYRAEVKFDTLSDTDRTGTKNQDFLFIMSSYCFIFCIRSTIYRIIIWCCGSKLCCTGIYHLVSGCDLVYLTECLDIGFCSSAEVCDHVIRKFHTFCFQKKFFCKRLSLKRLFHLYKDCNLVDKPAVDLCNSVDVFFGDISSDCFCYFPDTTVIYNCQFFDQLILIKTCKVIGHKTVYMLFQRTDGFHEGTFEVVADTHNFTGCFHLSCQSSLCSNKFIKRKSRDLNYTVVKHRLETCICFSCNSVRNLIQCIAQSNLCSNFSNRITCSFTCQCGRTTYTRVYLDNTVFKTLRMKSVLYVTSACDSKLCDNIQRRSTKHLVFFVSQCLGRSNYDGVTGMYTNRVNIFHVADCDTVACAVTHNFVFDFFPSCDAAFYQNFSYS